MIGKLCAVTIVREKVRARSEVFYRTIGHMLEPGFSTDRKNAELKARRAGIDDR
jgi:hypothetical protein